MFKIYGLHTPIFIKTVLAAEELGVDYQVYPVDLMKGEQKSPEHLARHPFGKVPALEHEGKYLFESNAILRYMADSKKSSLYPVALYERALVDQWIDYFSHQAGRWCSNIWFQKCIAAKYFKDSVDDKVLAEHTALLLEVMPTVDTHFASHEWLTGKNISLADVNAYILMRGFREAELDFSAFHHFNRWYAAFDGRPSVKKIEVFF